MNPENAGQISRAGMAYERKRNMPEAYGQQAMTTMIEKMRPLDEVLNNLAEVIDNLNKQTSILVDRLQPYLAPEPPQTEATSAPPSGGSQLIGKLSQMTYDLRQLRNFIHSVADRVE